MVKHYCDFCGTEVHQLDSYEMTIIIQPWEENTPLSYQDRLCVCKKCKAIVIDIINRKRRAK